MPKIIDCAPYFSTIENTSLQELEIWLSTKISEIKPKLAIGVGPCTVSSARSLPCIEKACKSSVPEKPILYGGPLASIPGQGWFFFNYLHAFAIIPGDAEIVLNQLLDKLRNNDKGKVNGVIYGSDENFSVNVIEKLDELPFPARDLFESALYSPSIRRNLFKFPFANIVCSRGCPNNCGFCSASSLRGGRQYKRSIENIGEELLTLSKQGVKSLTFYDDCLFSNRSSANADVIEFSRAVKSSGKDVVWQIEMRPDIVEILDEESIRIMYKSGCRQINIGAEKGTMKGLKEINKALTPEQTIEACKKIKDASPNFRVTATFIIGGPGETRQDALETLDFSKKLGLIFAHFYPLEIYPGTKLYEKKIRR